MLNRRGFFVVLAIVVFSHGAIGVAKAALRRHVVEDDPDSASGRVTAGLYGILQ